MIICFHGCRDRSETIGYTCRIQLLVEGRKRLAEAPDGTEAQAEGKGAKQNDYYQATTLSTPGRARVKW